ncbi:MAG: hypothetical protein KGQ60_00610 [Planctomycetes bacterium]|nr:hypothetical protein [Planctomycetota bacterium]
MAKKAKTKAATKAAKKATHGSNFFSRAIKKKSPSRRNMGKSSARSRKSMTDEDTFEKGLVFVAMSFSQPGMNDAFSAIKDSCRQEKLNAKRVDENVSSGFIILEIVDLIEQAEFIIFDLTYERPNVYYELGYAHGVGNAPSNILLLAREGTSLHFDIAALRVNFYDSTESLRKIVRESLRAMVKASRT